MKRKRERERERFESNGRKCEEEVFIFDFAVVDEAFKAVKEAVCAKCSQQDQSL